MRSRVNRRSVLATLAVFTVLIGAAKAVFAQSTEFTGFTPGNMVVTRSVYIGDATTLSAGQPLPPVCPSTAACGTAVAVANGVYPNVFNNDGPDGSFGITSPILLDQMTPSGTVMNTLLIPPNLLTTSFSSKSELAINLSTDGTALTFMGYMAPPNAIDVSNSNTPGAYDPTNPAGGSYYRAVAQIGANGAIQITPTNSYSGNNGRAAILGNGLYYMAGNSNNGGGTPANIISTTGVEAATPGQPRNTPALMIGNFSITQVTNPATGQPYTADKAGKDNNYRGLTIFNNTLYVTKGSGSNGINTVYQVGNSGTLPPLNGPLNTLINILPGFPTTLAKNADAANPFGIWFANATTLYVADEGDGTTANAASSTNAGLEKWSLVNGVWTRLYVLQNGLNLGQQYSVPNYPTSLNPATDGLRNITGRVNGDGTVTIWGITSTISASGDQGADPNKLVAITDVLANTSATVGASETFTTLRTARFGEVLRGVSFTPSAGNTPAVNVPAITSTANVSAIAVAPNTLAAAYGTDLAVATGSPVTMTLPITLYGTTVSIVDSANHSFTAPLLYVSPGQVNFLVPSGVATGLAQITITSGDENISTATVQVAAVAPGLFTFNNAALAAAGVLSVASNGSVTSIPVFTTNSAGSIVAAPIPGVATNQVYLTLYGTGIQGATAGSVTVTVNGVNSTVSYAGAQGTFAGLDQVNVLLPASVAGKGNVNVQLTAGGIASNPVQVTIQ